jgi:hypothetical protein
MVAETQAATADGDQMTLIAGREGRRVRRVRENSRQSEGFRPNKK